MSTNWTRRNFLQTGGLSAAALWAELPDFSADECEVIQDGAIDYEMRWKNGAYVSALAGQSVCVQVTMRSAKLYALQFSRGSAA